MNSSSFLKGADPLWLDGNSTGLLFIHGFTATAFEGKFLADWLHREAGFTVSVPLLPGHGTRPENLKGLRWMDWYEHVLEKYRELKQKVERIFICGQSMGGTLALNLAAHHPVDGIITLAAAVFLKDWRLGLLPVARHLVPYHFKSKGPDIRDLNLKPAVPTYKKYPVRSIDQFLELLRHTREDLAGVTAPALLIHSRKDRTIHFSNLDYIYDHISSPYKEKLVLKESYHVISIDLEREVVFKKVQDFIRHILDKISV